MIGVITLGIQPRPITLTGTSTLIFADITKISSNKLVFTNWRYDRNQNLFVAQPCKNCEPGKFNKSHGMVSWSLNTHIHRVPIRHTILHRHMSMSFPRFNLALNQVWIRISFVSWPWLLTGDKGHGDLTWGWFLPTTSPRKPCKLSLHWSNLFAISIDCYVVGSRCTFSQLI